ncbi:OLC1v1026353C1 [Oldenlandia corymbosa var. corymbosa]|uniref:OLC1v1026353C1 n=1 Tax=Oldenlandia corymbosa var. corymbosa TaxID=529605 RepID=A0AAV1C6X8_OLDCO|nr:OLC1v1026353C1 [Oldenlandia corymbosa var. corymbosa]
MASLDADNKVFNDVARKPELLRKLLRESVPDLKHPLTDYTDLLPIVHYVQNGGLLCERVPDSTCQKLIDAWKTAVDAWDRRLTSLASSDLPNNVYAGMCLLRLTIQECSEERFSASYDGWFNNIIFSHIQASEPNSLKVASWASVSDLLTRLGGSPTASLTAKKDGALGKKLIQPVLKLLYEKSPVCVLEEAIRSLRALINFFPFSVNHQYDNVEAALFSRFMSENDNTDLLKKLGDCLLMLPKSKGDADSWLIMMQKVLLFINSQLNVAFEGLKEETNNNEVVRLLVPPEKGPPSPLGGPTALEKHSDLAKKWPERVLVSRVSTLMSCCTMMLSGYPVQVEVPVRPLIALTKRVLMVDGSLSLSSPFNPILRHEFMCAELPMLHSCSLDLLRSLIKGLRSQLLPHMADITRLLTEYFRTCSLPEIRIKVYSVLELLLQSMGIGIAIYLIEVVTSNAFIDLGSSFHEKSSTCYAGSYKTSEEAEQQPSHKKRKLATSTGSQEEVSQRGSLDGERSRSLSPISVRIAALKVLEELLTVAGAFRSESWRPKVDNLLIGVATNACKGLAHDRNAAPMWQKFQCAALSALKASLLSPGRVRSPHLPQSLEIFRKGTREIGTTIYGECSSALLSLEVLIHPRANPLIDYQSFVVDDDDAGGASLKLPKFSNHIKNDSSLISMQAKQPFQTHSDDDLYKSWINTETEVGIGKNTATDEDPYGMSDDCPSVIGVDNLGHSVAIAADTIAVDGDEMRVESMAEETQKLLVTTSDHSAIKSHRLVSDSVASNSKNAFAEAPEKHDYNSQGGMDKTAMQGIEAPASEKEVEDLDNSRSKILDEISARVAATTANVGKSTTTASNAEDDDDYIPDIIDAEPDSE